MGKYWGVALLSIIALGVWAVSAETVKAQNGACPSGLVQVGTPDNAYPNNLLVCAENLYEVTGTYDVQNRYPCDDYMYVRDSIGTAAFETANYVYIVPPATQNVSGTAKVRFMLWFFASVRPFSPGSPIDRTYRLEYFNSQTLLTDSVVGNIADEEYITGRYNYLGLTYYYNVYLFEANLSTALDGYLNDGIGGFFVFRFIDDVDGSERAYSIASLQVAGADDVFPPHCPINGAVLPTDPTPTIGAGTPTPAPTNTPIYPTSAPATITYTAPTLTPFVFSTLPPQPLPTRVTLPTLPSITFPTLVPIATQQAEIQLSATPTAVATATPVPPPTIDAASTTNAIIGDMATRYAGQISLSESYLDINATNGISSTVESIEVVASGIALPFRFYKTIEQYSPNMWVFYRVVLICGGIMFTMRVWKIALGLLSAVVEFIRKIWEAIPFN